MNDRQLRIAYMIRTGSARPADLQELADSILAECHHPPMQTVAVHGDIQSTTGFLLCTLCDKRVQEYLAEEWAVMKSVIGVKAPNGDVKAIVDEQLAAHAAAGHIDLSKLPPGFGHSWSCTCDECVPPSVDALALCQDIAARAALESEELEPRQTLHVLKNRDVSSSERPVYFDPTKFVAECESYNRDADERAFQAKVEFKALAHNNADGNPCSFEAHREKSARTLVEFGASMLACPVCGRVLKDRNGLFREFADSFIWQGKLAAYLDAEFQYLRGRKTYFRSEAGKWETTTPQMHADVIAHLRAFFDGDLP